MVGRLPQKEEGCRCEAAGEEQKSGRYDPIRGREHDDEHAREEPYGNDCCACDENSHGSTLHPGAGIRVCTREQSDRWCRERRA
jgi:hypothetical protein